MFAGAWDIISIMNSLLIALFLYLRLSVFMNVVIVGILERGVIILLGVFLGKFRHDLIVFLCIRSSFSLFCILVLCSSGAAYVSDDLMSDL